MQWCGPDTGFRKIESAKKKMDSTKGQTFFEKKILEVVNHYPENEFRFKKEIENFQR